MSRLVSQTAGPHGAWGQITMDADRVPPGFPRVYRAETDDEGRMQWPIDAVITGGGWIDLSAAGHESFRTRCVLPPGSTELTWERVPGDNNPLPGPIDLKPLVAPVSPLHVEGRQLIQADGIPYRYRGATHFLHFQRYLEWKRGNGGEPCDYAGALDYRVTALMTYIPGTVGLPPLRPENYSNYWAEAPGYVAYLAAKGRRLHLCVRCDIQMSGQSPAELRAIDSQWAEIMGPLGLLSKGNEAFKNSWSPEDARHPGHGVVWCSGTNKADEAPNYLSDDNVIEWEGRRDWPKVTSSNEDMWYVSRDSGKPILHVETMGFAEYNQPGKRSNDPNLARQIGASCAALNGDDRTRGGYVNGGAVHLQEAITSVPLGPIQEQCRAAFFEGLQ